MTNIGWHFRYIFYAPLGASEATVADIEREVHLTDGRFVKMRDFLGEILVEPFRDMNLTFGVAAMGWCHDPELLHSTLCPLLLASVKVSMQRADEPAHFLIANRLLPLSNGAYASAYAYPFDDADDVKLPESGGFAPMNPEVFGPILEQFYLGVIEKSVEVDPLVVALGVGAQTVELAERKLAEAQALLTAQIEALRRASQE